MSTKEMVGLEHVSDEVLARIAEQEDHNGEMTYEAQIAFRELARRSGRDV